MTPDAADQELGRIVREAIIRSTQQARCRELDIMLDLAPRYSRRFDHRYFSDRNQPKKGTNMTNKTRVGNIAVDQLRSVIARIEKLTEEKEVIAADIRDVYAEAAGNGLDRKAIRQIIKLRKLDASEREEQETVLDTYRRVLGMLPELDDEDEAA